MQIIYDIGTDIFFFIVLSPKMLFLLCKSIIFSGIESSRRDLAFYSIKTRFKTLFKSDIFGFAGGVSMDFCSERATKLRLFNLKAKPEDKHYKTNA